MTFDIYNTTTNQWVSILPYVFYQGIDGSRNDVDGSAAGRVLDQAKMFRDRLATKYKWNITTRAISSSDAKMIEGLLMPEFFQIRTDYFTPTVTQYTVYSNNVTKAYIINKGTDYLVKLSFPIVQQ